MTIGADTGTEPVRISALEFDVLWEHYYGLDQMPLVLKVPSPGRTDDERDRIVRSVWDGLARRGLGSPVDPHPGLTHLLHLLRRPDREIDGRLWLTGGVGSSGSSSGSSDGGGSGSSSDGGSGDGSSGGELRLLAAATGEEAVLATLSRGTLSLRPAEASGLPRFALSVLPPAPAGPGQSITLPTADFAAAAREARKQEELAVALRGRGVRDFDATALAEMIGDIVNRGQYGSAARDRWGRRVRAARVISFFDTAAGRYLQVRRASDDAVPWTTISPADSRRMLQHLTALHEEQVG